MILNYDAATDSLNIHLSERPSVDSDEAAEGVVLDYDASQTRPKRTTSVSVLRGLVSAFSIPIPDVENKRGYPRYLSS